MTTVIQLSGRSADSPRQLLTPHEAAMLLDVKAQTLALWRHTKRYALPYVKVGRNVHYRRADIEAFLEGRTITPDALDR